MNKSWIKKSRLSKEYEDRVDLFLTFAIDNRVDPNMISCPCIKCVNFLKIKNFDVKDHLYSHGIDMSYEKWILHRETPPSIGSSHTRARIEKKCDENKDAHLIDMINNVEDHFVGHPNELTKILEEAEIHIYLESNVKKLSFLVRMYNLKAHYWLSALDFLNCFHC